MMPNPLANQTLPLEDIIVPNSVSLWPLAFGWWLLLALIIACFIGAFFVYKRYQKKWRYRKEALNLLKGYQSSLQNTQSALADKDIIIKYIECLKRTAISAYPTQSVQALYGREWIAFLNQQTPSPLFKDELATFICESQYKEAITINKHDVYFAVETWIKKHSTQIKAKPTKISHEVA